MRILGDTRCNRREKGYPADSGPFANRRYRIYVIGHRHYLQSLIGLTKIELLLLSLSAIFRSQTKQFR